jgi:membrane glycosyltransferase
MSTLGAIPISPLRRSWRRQVFFFTTVVVMTGLATWVMADILWRGGMTGIEKGILVLFVPLFGMVMIGFVQALCGFLILLRSRDPFSLSRTVPESLPKVDDLPATAIAVPIFNEDVSRVYEGLRTMYLDLVRSGFIGRFDVFILSDSNDPNKWIEEEVAWIDLCKQVKGFGRMFYRKRNVALNRKSGNISDFLRRWGRKYRYMVVLDADSLINADTLVRLVQMMEVNPQAGIIQTVPSPIQGQTFFARLMQFAGGTELLAGGMRQFLGAQCDHPRGAVHRALRLADVDGGGRGECAVHEPRLCGGGVNAPGKLRGVDGV